ncbi:uncharacterized protein LOC144184302 isoform X1 [Stigmatopora nigra]
MSSKILTLLYERGNCKITPRHRRAVVVGCNKKEQLLCVGNQVFKFGTCAVPHSFRKPFLFRRSRHMHPNEHPDATLPECPEHTPSRLKERRLGQIKVQVHVTCDLSALQR